MTYNVFEAARQCHVRRVVFASTNHVTGFYPRSQRIGPNAPVRPDTVYATSKVFGEALGRLYCEKFGLEVICVRIGAFAATPPPGSEPMWLGHRDAVALFTCCVAAPLRGFVLVYGASANAPLWWDDAEARRLLGYEPTEGAAGRADAREQLLQGHPYTDHRYHAYPNGAPASPGADFASPGADFASPGAAT